MSKKSWVLFILIVHITSIRTADGLKVVQDDDLMALIRKGKHIVALFTVKNCESCTEFENELVKLEDDINKELDAQLVELSNSQLTRLYSPTKEPALVFFRHGIPLLYHGPPNDDLIFHTFSNNREPVVKELTDETFEHLTQAATGATTGDWFIMFYSPECVDCHRLVARWEAVGTQLKSRMNLARINLASSGSSTARRFAVDQAPSFLLFKQGKLYRYKIQKYDIPSFVAFAQDWYKNMKPERIPLPKTPFDEFVEAALSSIQNNSLLVQIGVGAFIIVLLTYLFIGKLIRKKTPAVKPKKGEKGEKQK